MIRFKRAVFVGAALLCVMAFSGPVGAGQFGYFNDRVEESPQYHHYHAAPRYQDGYQDYYRMQREQDRLYNEQQRLQREQERSYREFNRSHRYMRGGRHHY